jgi:hypothetical protein
MEVFTHTCNALVLDMSLCRDVRGDIDYRARGLVCFDPLE